MDVWKPCRAAAGMQVIINSCIGHSAAAVWIVLSRRAVRLEVLVIVLLAVVEARLVRARHDRVAVVCVMINHTYIYTNTNASVHAVIN
jgi:hypothetical protein